MSSEIVVSDRDRLPAPLMDVISISPMTASEARKTLEAIKVSYRTAQEHGRETGDLIVAFFGGGGPKAIWPQIETPVAYLAGCLHTSPANIYRLKDRGCIQHFLVPLYGQESVGRLTEGLLRPMAPMLKESAEHIPVVFQQACTDAKAEGKGVNYKHVMGAVKQFNRTREQAVPDGTLPKAKRLPRSSNSPMERPGGVKNEDSPTQDESAITWADDIAQLLKDALALAKAHPESPQKMIRSIKQALGEAVDLAKSDAPHLIHPSQITPEEGIF